MSLVQLSNVRAALLENVMLTTFLRPRSQRIRLEQSLLKDELNVKFLLFKGRSRQKRPKLLFFVYLSGLSLGF